MDPVTLLQNSGPLAALVAMLWWATTKGLAGLQAFHSALIAEIRADREVMREEFGEMRTEHRQDLQAVRDEIAALRDAHRRSSAGDE